MRISKIAFKTWLESAANYEKQRKKGNFSLKTVSLLANLLDNPQNAFNSLHIAGSKGKGSVSALVASILQSADFSAGLYTSPHILDFYERVAFPGGFFDSAVYEESAGTLVPFIEEMSEKLNEEGFEQASWFELITLFAFLCFKNAHVDWGVFETGLGGRFDATNVLVPKVSVITPIELEHTEYLGTTIAQIAGEKAGIIKPNVPVCVSNQSTEARTVFEKQAKKLNAPAYFMEDIPLKADFCFDKHAMNVTIDFGDFALKGKNTPLFPRPIHANMALLGSIQVQNAALASLVAKIAAPAIPIEAIEAGLSKAKLSGRFEIFDVMYDENQKLTVIFDGAHTVNSIRLTLETYRRMFGSAKYHLLFACAYDKKVEDIAPLFLGDNGGEHENIRGGNGNKRGDGSNQNGAPKKDDGSNTNGSCETPPCAHEHFTGGSENGRGAHESKPSFITLTKPGNDKPSDIARLKEAFVPLCRAKHIEYTVNEDVCSAAQSAAQNAARENAILLVTGSFYLVAEVQKSLRQNRHVSPVLG